MYLSILEPSLKFKLFSKHKEKKPTKEASIEKETKPKKSKKKKLEVDQLYNPIESPSEPTLVDEPKPKVKRHKSTGKSKKGGEVTFNFNVVFNNFSILLFPGHYNTRNNIWNP